MVKRDASTVPININDQVLPVYNVSVETPVSRQTSANDEQQNVSHSYTCCFTRKRLGSLYYFVLFHYYLCLVPYRPLITNKGLIMDRFIPQMITCGFFHLCALFAQSKIIVNALQIDVLSDPLKVIPLAFAFADSMYIGFWVHEFWRKSSQLKELILETSDTEVQSKRKPFIIYLKNVFFTILPLIFFAYLQFHQPEKPDNINNPHQEAGNKNDTNTTWHFKAFKTASYMIGIPRHFIFQSVDVLLLLLALTSYEITAFHLQSAEEITFLKQEQRETAPDHLTQYWNISKNLKAYFKNLNGFGSGLHIAWFCNIIPWMSFRPLQTLQLQNFPYTFIHNWTLMIMHGTIWGLCSESKRKVQSFLEVVTEDVYHNSSPNDDAITKMTFLKQIEHLLSSCGVKAGRFFQLSYDSMGNVIGLGIAYALLYIQFYSSYLDRRNTQKQCT